MSDAAAASAQENAAPHSVALLGVTYQPQTHEIQVNTSGGVLAGVLALGVLVAVARGWSGWRAMKSLELDAAELGVGTGKITLKPNLTDRQVAYAIWVELSTRKVGLPIDLEHDVISEVYDSWFQFFGVTRELIKTVPVSRVSEDSTRKIIDLSIDILNQGLRPHLTQWQARYRRWYDHAINGSGQADEAPQAIQARYPHYAELREDLLAVNRRLMAYRKAMKALVYGSRA